MKSNIKLSQFNTMTQEEKTKQLKHMAKIYNQKISRLEKSGNISIAKHYTDNSLQKQSTRGFKDLTKKEQKEIFNKLRLANEDYTITNRFAIRIMKKMGVGNISEYNEKISERFSVWKELDLDVEFTYEEKLEMIYGYSGKEDTFRKNLQKRVQTARERKERNVAMQYNALDKHGYTQEEINDFYGI